MATNTSVPPEALGTSGQDIFDAALTNEPAEAPEATSTPAPEATPSPIETTGGRLKDPVSGKFVPKTPSQEVPQEQVQEPVQPEPILQEDADVEPAMPAQVPSWRLAEEAQRRREAEAQYQEAQQQMRNLQMQMSHMQQAQQNQQQPQIDPIADPEGYTGSIRENVQQELASIRLENSISIAQYKHGDELFNDAFNAFLEVSQNGDRSAYTRVMQSPNQGEAVVQWYKERQTLNQIGNDPDTWLQKKLDEKMADPAFQAEVIKRFQQSQNGAAPSQQQVKLPPSLSRATSAAPSGELQSEMTGEAMFEDAVKWKR